jgi:protein-S-isoprenylcysteine O-methyltransferase Ste14
MSAPLAFSHAYAFLFWAIFAWAFWPEFKLITRPRPQAKTVAATSLRVLTIGLTLAFWLAFSLSWRSAWRWSPGAGQFTFFAGLALLVLGSLLRRHCWRVLGNYFTAHVAAQINQPIINTGAYAWVRHPSYSGALLMNIGVGIALGNWASLASLSVASIALYGYRIVVEEKFLLINVGEPYRAFMASRKRLVPYVF